MIGNHRRSSTEGVTFWRDLKQKETIMFFFSLVSWRRSCLYIWFIWISFTKKRKEKKKVLYCFSWINGCSNACLTFKRFCGSNWRILSRKSRSWRTFFIWSSGKRWWPIKRANKSRQGFIFVMVVILS